MADTREQYQCKQTNCITEMIECSGGKSVQRQCKRTKYDQKSECNKEKYWGNFRYNGQKYNQKEQCNKIRYDEKEKYDERYTRQYQCNSVKYTSSEWYNGKYWDHYTDVYQCQGKECSEFIQRLKPGEGFMHTPDGRIIWPVYKQGPKLLLECKLQQCADVQRECRTVECKTQYNYQCRKAQCNNVSKECRDKECKTVEKQCHDNVECKWQYGECRNAECKTSQVECNLNECVTVTEQCNKYQCKRSQKQCEMLECRTVHHPDSGTPSNCKPSSLNGEIPKTTVTNIAPENEVLAADYNTLKAAFDKLSEYGKKVDNCGHAEASQCASVNCSCQRIDYYDCRDQHVPRECKWITDHDPYNCGCQSQCKSQCSECGECSGQCRECSDYNGPQECHECRWGQCRQCDGNYTECRECSGQCRECKSQRNDYPPEECYKKKYDRKRQDKNRQCRYLAPECRECYNYLRQCEQCLQRGIKHRPDGTECTVVSL